MSTDHEPLERREYEAATLMAEHPPRLYDANKRVVADIACPPGAIHRGRLGYSRWAAMALPDRIDLAAAADRVVLREDFFDYVPLPEPAGAIEWHVNFADPHLFVAYAGGLFAQDEMQVAEHPALAALKQALTAEGLPALTVEGDRPTPVLVTGVERRCRVATEPDAAEGRPHGLYGNAFARASAEVVARATTPIDPPTITNLVALAALPGGWGRYTREQIEHTLVTAYTGFRAAVLESARLARPSATRAPVVIHTGYWGCGAFGGNRILMALLQVVAGWAAGVDRLVFHAGIGGRGPLDEALELLWAGLSPAASSGPDLSTAEILDRLVAHGFTWGVSDGN